MRPRAASPGRSRRRHRSRRTPAAASSAPRTPRHRRRGRRRRRPATTTAAARAIGAEASTDHDGLPRRSCGDGVAGQPRSRAEPSGRALQPVGRGHRVAPGRRPGDAHRQRLVAGHLGLLVVMPERNQRIALREVRAAQPAGMSYGTICRPVHAPFDPVVDGGLEVDRDARAQAEPLDVGSFMNTTCRVPFTPRKRSRVAVDRGVELVVGAQRDRAAATSAWSPLASMPANSWVGVMKLALPLGVFHLRSRAGTGRGKPPGWNMLLVEAA